MFNLITPPIYDFKEVYIYGAGRLGEALKALFAKHDINVKGLIDSNLKISGVITLENVEDKNAYIAVASITYMYDIEDRLKKAGFKNIVSFGKLTIMFPEIMNFNSAFDGLLEDYEEYKHEYDLLYDLFDDAKSKTVLSTVLKYRETLDTELFNQIVEPNEKQYFEDFVPKYDFFIDGGAFDGDTTIRFIKFNPNYKKVYFFEPDVASMEMSQETLNGCANIEYLPFGISDSSKVLRFDSRGDSGSLFSDNGNDVIKCIALDSIVKENNCFIKLDIEGKEIEALNGAKKLIEGGACLAICVYHKPSDLRKIPALIKNINIKYKFYLRHYTSSIFETVLYCIPT